MLGISYFLGLLWNVEKVGCAKVVRATKQEYFIKFMTELRILSEIDFFIFLRLLGNDEKVGCAVGSNT